MEIIKDILSGFAVIKSFQAEKEIQKRFEKDNESIEGAKYERRYAEENVNLLSTAASVIMRLGVFIFGAWMAVSGTGVTPGIVLVFLQLVNFVIYPIERIPAILANRKAAVAIMDKLADTLSEQGDDQSGKSPCILRQQLSIRDVFFGYGEEQDILAAIEQAGLAELIRTHGKEYICGENGSALSGGEKQRISIARALLRKTSVLLMDEATVALDEITASEIMTSVLAMKDITGIIITHRLDENVLKEYDGIVVLHNGKVEEFGTFEELLEQKGYFYSFYSVF